MSVSIYFVAVEDSADVLGAEVMNELVRADQGVRVMGVGGPRMRLSGAVSDVDVSGLAILGLFDGLAAFRRIKRTVRAVADDIQREVPDAVVLIDSWGFMWRLAREIKERGLPCRVIKLIGPQVWATRPGRARVLARWCDHLLCIHPFEAPYYEGTGLPVTVVGNPAIGRAEQGDGEGFREKHGLSKDAVVVGLLLGSRASELRRVAPTFIEVAHRLVASIPGVVVVCLPAPSVYEEVVAMSRDWEFEHVLTARDESAADAMAAMDVALACSGTVTTELAEQGAAVVTGYRLGWLSALIVRGVLMRTEFISLINVAAGRAVIPEFVQGDMRVANVLAAVQRLATDPTARATQVEAQKRALDILADGGGGGTASRSAEAILADIRIAQSSTAPPISRAD